MTCLDELEVVRTKRKVGNASGWFESGNNLAAVKVDDADVFMFARVESQILDLISGRIERLANVCANRMQGDILVHEVTL